MRLKNIYTEREKENIQTVDCLMCCECIHKCPEDNALRMTFCGKTIYKSSRMNFISRFAPKKISTRRSVNTMIEMNERQKELFVRKSSRIASSYLRRMKELSDDITALSPFFDVLKKIYVNFEPIHNDNDILIGTLCAMIPSELIYAAGAKPIRLCSGSYTAYSIGDEAVPRDACPLTKAVMGFVQTQALPIYKNCSLMAVPITCDCKKKLAGLLS